MSPAQLMFAHDLEKIVALTETLTTAFKEIDEEKNRTIHQTLLLPLLGNWFRSSPARLTFAHVILWILAAPIEEKRKRERKKEITTADPSSASPIAC
jgi:hypothetical protein